MEPLRPDDPRQLGPYRLLRRVGAGGMGVVFLAVAADGAGDDLAAVKAVRTEYAEDAEFRARFAGEVALARRVHGPYTARVLDADTEGSRPWLATEYVSGPALHHAVREAGPFPEGSLRTLAAGLARALDAIHSVGLVHRDLKPSNVLLSPRGPRVIDFGIARATDATALTRTGQTLGTPAFMSPEQATGAPLGPESDLFAFGGVLLFAGTGRQPFGTGDPAALLYRVVNEEPDLSGLPEDLLPLVSACLAKTPGNRPGLGSLLAELTGTALPGAGADDPTAWLPTAVATKVMGTVAVTRRELAAHEAPVVGEAPEDPEVSGTGEASENGGTPAEYEAPGVPEASGHQKTAEAAEASEGGEDSGAQGNPGADGTPEEGTEAGHRVEPESTEQPGARRKIEGRATLPSWALSRPGSRESPLGGDSAAAESPEEPGAEEPEAANQASPTGGSEKAQETTAPAKSASVRGGLSTPRERNNPVYPDPEPRGFSTKAIWGAVLSALALVVGLVIILDPNAARVGGEDDASASEEGSSGSSRNPRTSTVPEEADPADVQELAWLSEDRFAVLSSAGVHLYETDQAEPVEQLVDSGALSLNQSKLVTDPDGSALAVLDGGLRRKDTPTALIWDLTADESHEIPLSEEFKGNAPLALSPGGQTLYTGSSGADNVVAAYDVRSGEELYTIDLPEFQEGYRMGVDELATSPDGRLLFAAVTGGLGVWDAATGEPVPGFPGIREWTRNIPGPMATADDLVATAVYDRLLLWNPWSQEEPESYEVTFDGSQGHPELDPEVTPWITSLSIADDGNTIVATGHLSQFHGFLIRWDRKGEVLDEQWTDAAQYRAAQTPPSGEGVLLVPLPLMGKAPNTLTLLDDDLETAREFELPAVHP
jgi:serine/threonine protein kinase